jgi:restriction endonuclease S subunit
LLPEFAQAYFQHCLYTGQFARVAVQTTSIAHLTAVRFKEMLVPAPPMKEQQAFVETREAMQSAKRALGVRIAATQSLKSLALTTLGQW